jgi:hypothetical protein
VTAALAGAVVVVLAVAGCSSESPELDAATRAGTGDRARGPEAAPDHSLADPVPRAPGPAADLAEELTGGGGILLASARAGEDGGGPEVAERELVAAGTAVPYRSVGPLGADGRFQLEPSGPPAEYRTRVLVRRPAEDRDFDGTVVVEWLNVSGGFDAAPDLDVLRPELVRRGLVWVGVSAQRVGVAGGPVAVGVGAGSELAGKGLVGADPERYGSLVHPGDAYAYDIVTQVARALRQDRDGALGGLEPARVLAVGESQSAFALTTYVNGIQPLTGAFDGFLLHSRGGAPAPLGESGTPIDIAGAVFGEPAVIRADTRVPVLMVQTETDLVSVLNYLPARQDDTDRIRLWEVAGTAHADRFLLGPVADTLDCGAEVNDGPQRFVVRAALRALDRWVRTGEPPGRADRLEVDAAVVPPALVRDADGIARGGVRLPPVEVPVDRLSGEPGPDPSVICLLLGSTVPLAAERLVELHGDRERYLEAFGDSADRAVARGFLLREDRAELLRDARPERLPA